MVAFGMVIDLNSCIGCLACVMACKVENSTGPGVFWSFVEDEELGTYPSVSRRFVPRLCMHCRYPACVDVCPTGASYRRDDGIVLIDPDKCVGCRSCIVACPYGARYFIKENEGYFKEGSIPCEIRGRKKHRPGVVEKCTFCVDRLREGRKPACVRTCPVQARTFGDLSDPAGEVSELIRARHGFQFHKGLGCEPSVYYLAP